MKEQGCIRMEKIDTDYKTRSGHNYSLRTPLGQLLFFFPEFSLSSSTPSPLYAYYAGYHN